MSEMKCSRRGTVFFQGLSALGIFSFAAIVIFSLTIAQDARAIPSFARQTNQECSACHYTPPELNSAGREFKLRGYAPKADDSAMIDSKPPSKRSGGLELLKSLPLSAVFNVGFTSLKASIPGSQNGTLQLPQGASLFLSGRWSEHTGSWIEFHYSPVDDHFSVDNSDIRYANRKKVSNHDLIYGITVNNAPTVEDVWNSTPAWGFPFNTSEIPPSPVASAAIDGPLAQDVAGIGGYAFFAGHLYADVTGYRTAHIGAQVPFTGENSRFNIHGVAPYWRLAWEQMTTYNDFEIGTFGMHLDTTPNSFLGLEDKTTDIAGDFQWNRTIPQLGRDVISLRGTYIRENSSLNGLFDAGSTALAEHHLTTIRANVLYHFGSRLAVGGGWFNVTGITDPVLFAPAAITGSANGDPKTKGYIVDISWWPKQNLDLEVQYTGFMRFNGAKFNYDGAGRNASDNNTLFILGRFLF